MLGKIIEYILRILWGVFILYALVIGIIGAAVIVEYAMIFMDENGYIAISEVSSDKLFYIIHLFALFLGAPLSFVIAFKINPFEKKSKNTMDSMK